MKITREQLIKMIKEELGDPAGEAEAERQRRARTAWKRRFTSVEEVNAIADLMENDPEFKMLSRFVDEFRRRSQRGTPPQDVLEIVLPESVPGGLIAKVILKARERLPADERLIKKPKSPALSGAEMDRIAPSLEESTLEEQQQYTSAEKALFKKITGSGLGKTLVQKLLSVFKNNDVQYITPQQRDLLFKDFADYSSGRNKPSAGSTLSPQEAKKLDFERLVQGSRDVPDGFEDETFKILQRFLKSGELYIPNKNMPAGGTSRERFFDALKSAQSDQPEAYGTGEGQLAAKARKAMEVLQDTQNLVISLSQSENNLSVEDYAKLKAPAVEAIETVYGLTGMIGMAIAPSDEDEFMRAQEKMRAELKAQAEEQWEAEQAIKQRDIRQAVKRAMTPASDEERAAARVAMFGQTPGQQVTTNEGKIKMKITKQQLINIIKEELAVISEQDGDEKLTGKGGAETAASRFAKLRQRASAALEKDGEISAQERQVLSLIEDFFNELAQTPGVDLAKRRGIMEPLLQRIKKAILSGIEQADSQEDKDADTTNVNVPSLGS